MRLILYRLLFCVLFPLGLASCVALTAMPDPPRQTAQAQQDPEYLFDKPTLDKYDAEKGNPENQLKVRNVIIDERMFEIDTQFAKFESILWQQGVGTGIGTDWVSLAISGATATAGGETTKSVLGAVQAFLTGAKASFDKNALFDRTLPALMAQMVAERAKVRVEIEQHKRLSVLDYSLFTAASNLQKYIRAGSIFGSIQTIAGDADQKAKKANEVLFDMRSKDFFAKEKQNRVAALLQRIDKLGDSKAIDLATNPPVQVQGTKIGQAIALRDKSESYKKNATSAKAILKMMLSLTDRTDANLDAWEAAIKSAE